MLESYNNLFSLFCDEYKFEQLETDTDSLYLALAEEKKDDCKYLRRELISFQFVRNCKNGLWPVQRRCFSRLHPAYLLSLCAEYIQVLLNRKNLILSV